MQDQVYINPDFYKLLTAFLDGQLSGEQLDLFEKSLKNNPEYTRQYLEFMVLTVGLRKFSQTQRGIIEQVFQQSPKESIFWHILGDYEKTAPAIVVDKKPLNTHVIQPTNKNIEKVQHRVSRLALSTLALASAALILMISYVTLFVPQNKREIAVLSDSINAKWDNGYAVLQKGCSIYNNNERFSLLSGFARIAFNTGAEVLLEAPASFSFQTSEQMYLYSGRLSAFIPGKAIGFSVATPSCRVIDLGTEFGVSVDEQGSCQLHMLAGKASLLAGLVGQSKSEETLFAGQARSVDSQTGKSAEIPCMENEFIRQINSAAGVVWRGQNLNLVDIMSGGRGLETPQYDNCLDPITGKIVHFGIIDDKLKVNPPRQFIKTSDTHFIDGIFSPDSKNALTAISSTGLTYTFPFSGGTIWYPITPVKYFITKNNKASQSRSLGQIEKPAFYLHANLGITMDLNAIRDAFPKAYISGFCVTVGKRWDWIDYKNKIDYYILVDGQSRWQKTAMDFQNQTEDVYIPFNESDRFLTFVTTESDDGAGNDWGVFVDPVIEMKLR